MTFLLRKIRKNRWYKTEPIDWLLDGELQADPLGDLATKSNELSVYHVVADESNLDRIIASLAVNVEQLSHVDFAIFDEKIISDVGIKMKESEGDLPDEQVNKWHSDLYEISAVKLLTLAKEINDKAKIERRSFMQVLNMVANSLNNNYFDRSRIKWTSQTDLDKLDKLLAGRP